jgi:ribosomal protein L17
MCLLFIGDILCENELPQLREKIIGCLDGSVEALDSKLNKIDLRRRLDNLEMFVQTRAAETQVDEVNQALRSMIAVKADMAVVEEITATKASIKELRRLKDRMINQMDAGADDGSADGSVDQNANSNQKPKGHHASQELIDDMTNKFDLLYK